MSCNTNYCRLCLQKVEGFAKNLSKDWEIAKQVNNLFPGMDTSLVINFKLCIKCSKYVQLSHLMIDTVTKNEQKILLDLQNIKLLEKITCRLCLNNEKSEVTVCLSKNTNEAARHVIKLALIDLDFDIFSKPVMCNSCWKIVKSIYLFKKKYFAIEKILKYYCAANKINSLDRNELEKVSLYYQEELQQFSENLDENLLFDRIASCIGNSNLTSQDMYFNNFTEDKVFKEVPCIANTLNNFNSELLKEEREVDIKEEKLCKFEESDENLCMAADAVNLESRGRIQHTDINPNASQIQIIKTENVENICHSIKSPWQADIDTKETIHGGNDNVLMIHGSDHETDLSVKCEQCPYETSNKVDVEVHLKAHQSNENILKCSECYYITTCSNSLRSHKLIHQSNYNFKCHKCSYRGKRKTHLITHMLVHQDNYNFPCNKCSYRAKSKNRLVAHMSIHQDNYNFLCNKCDYRGKTKSYLARHMLVHQDNNNFPCNKCIYQAKSKRRLVTHMLVHEDNYNFPCNKCSYRAKSKLQLATHMLVHEDSYDFQCYNCNYQTKNKPNLISHMVVHRNNCNFPCNKCSYRAKSKPRLVTHMLVHEDNYFQCYNCNYQSKIKYNLVSHMIVHQDNYNFPCNKCSYRAKSKSRLVTHMSVHQDNYNFPCSKCSYKAKRKRNLASHMLNHL